MFKLRNNVEKNIYDFSRIFKEYWSNHSGSIFVPSYLVIINNNICSAIILFKYNELIETTIKAFRSGVGIVSFAVCWDGDIRKDFSGQSLSVLSVEPNEMALKIFPYKINELFEVEWNQDCENIDCSSYLRFQSILHQNSNDEEMDAMGAGFGFSKERRYFHNLRMVLGYIEKNPDIYIIDLASPLHPEWVDADNKLEGLCNILKSRKWISEECHRRLVSVKEKLGKPSFVMDIANIISYHKGTCNMKEFVSPEVFAEILHNKIFDYKFDLNHGEGITW